MKAQRGLTQHPDCPDRSSAVEGMAYFPGTGPDGRTCADCNHFAIPLRRGTACRQFWRMTHVFPRKPLSGKDFACRYFEEKGKGHAKRTPAKVTRSF